jgi:hypothetical protein
MSNSDPASAYIEQEYACKHEGLEEIAGYTHGRIVVASMFYCNDCGKWFDERPKCS